MLTITHHDCISNLSLYHIQSDDEDEDVHSNTRNINQSSRTKNSSIQRRQTIGTAHGRSHLTPLKQIQEKFWPSRQSNNVNINEHEQIPMIDQKKTNTIQRSFSTNEKKSSKSDQR
jgi:hypothetical protein